MTLRDYFAAKVMESMIAHHGITQLQADQITKLAYTYADSMLTTRKMTGLE